jgi:hypothetical protein
LHRGRGRRSRRAAQNAEAVPSATSRAQGAARLSRRSGPPSTPSGHIPTGVQTVTLEEWRHMLDVTGIINRDGSYREQFRRIRVTLKNAGVIGIWEDLVWAVT